MTTFSLDRLAGFDTETTGVNPTQDRIVTAAFYFPAGHTQEVLINPGVPIPEQAANVHGVTTEHAVAYGQSPESGLRWIANTIHELWAAGHPIVGHNVVYDLTILAFEMERHGLGTFRVAGPVLDTLVLDKHVDKYRRGSRNLTAVSEHYGVDLGDDAHNADSDAKAATLIAEKIVAKHFRATSVADLHRNQIKWAAQQAASLQEYLRRTKPETVIDGNWPLRAATVGV